MARTNLNTKSSARLLLLKTDACSELEEETEQNPLSIINTLLVLKNPKKLSDWVNSKSDNNSIKLVEFIVAV